MIKECSGEKQNKKLVKEKKTRKAVDEGCVA